MQPQHPLSHPFSFSPCTVQLRVKCLPLTSSRVIQPQHPLSHPFFHSTCTVQPRAMSHPSTSIFTQPQHPFSHPLSYSTFSVHPPSLVSQSFINVDIPPSLTTNVHLIFRGWQDFKIHQLINYATFSVGFLIVNDFTAFVNVHELWNYEIFRRLTTFWKINNSRAV